MQPAGQGGFVPLYDGARVYTGQLKEGMGYKDLRPTVVIFLLNEDTFPEQERSNWRFLLKDESMGGGAAA